MMHAFKIALIVFAVIVYLAIGLFSSMFGEGANPETGKTLSSWWILFWPLRIFM